MSISGSSGFRAALLAAGITVLAVSAFLLFRERITGGLLLAFAGLSAISLSETHVDYTAKMDARSFGGFLRKRSDISTLGKVCEIGSVLCLAAALLNQLVSR